MEVTIHYRDYSSIKTQSEVHILFCGPPWAPLGAWSAALNGRRVKLEHPHIKDILVNDGQRFEYHEVYHLSS